MINSGWYVLIHISLQEICLLHLDDVLCINGKYSKGSFQSWYQVYMYKDNYLDWLISEASLLLESERYTKQKVKDNFRKAGDGELYGYVKQVIGGGRFLVYCFDFEDRVCRVDNKVSKAFRSAKRKKRLKKNYTVAIYGMWFVVVMFRGYLGTCRYNGIWCKAIER